MIKILQQQFEKRGFVFDQILRQNNLAIYSQSFDGKLIAYETIVIKTGLPHPHSRESFTSVEIYPSDEQFGLNGWSFANYGDLSKALQKAQNKFEQIKANYGNQ